MPSVLSVSICAVLLIQSAVSFTFSKHGNCQSRSMNMVAVAAEKSMQTLEAPDFYWEYRLDRLVQKLGSEVKFSPSNYPDVSGFKDLYDAYYLDLTLQGKLDGFDWESEKKITDDEWLVIYKKISQWTTKTAKANKPDTSSLPTNDFDLLKQFYPSLNLRDLETSFSVEEVGSNFPYKSMKEMLEAAMSGKLSVPGYSSSITSLEASDAKQKLSALKESSMKKIDAIFDDALSFAKNPFPDDKAKAHYQALRAKLASFPQGDAGWAAYRSNMEKEVDEMARLASKKEEHHGHHGHDEEEGHGEPHLSPAQEFEAKYGRSLEEMQERMAKYKSDPKGFLESSIVQKYGKNGLEVWKKSQEFSEKLGVMTAADKQAAEAAFTDFLKKA
mmetsp:Transcript_13020/g.17831  ORF Transcript_13020/g.17831 Transcript_13020/m.17831 type:complete len:386 (-) Transcript_13020:243-1400(-)